MLRSLSRGPKTLSLASRYCRSITSSAAMRGEGDTGGLRSGGSAHSDAFTRREKAAEDMYIREREKEIMKLLRERITKQEAVLATDRKILTDMENQYGKANAEA